MTSLVVILIVIGLIALFFGLLVTAVKWMLWIGVVLLVVGVVAALLRRLRRSA